VNGRLARLPKVLQALELDVVERQLPIVVLAGDVRRLNK
jgi:hypothetical protein